MNNTNISQFGLSRRELLHKTHLGLGSIALHSLLARNASQASELPEKTSHAATAKNVILLTMSGGPSQIDLFDPKPEVNRLDGKPLPEGVNEKFALIRGTPLLMGSPYQFSQHGESGAVFSNLLPKMAGIADELTVVRSLSTESFNHDPAMTMFNTGSTRPGRPCMGSWLSYGLGSENKDLPAFVVLISGDGQPLGAHAWSSGFLPTSHQGVRFRSARDPVLFLKDPEWMSRSSRRRSLDALTRLNRLEEDRTGDSEIDTRIQAYEMAFRMQTAVPNLVNLSQETAATHKLYGSEPGQPSFAANCLMARRMVEDGVRFVQLYHRGWDHHGLAHTGGIDVGLPERCHEVDQATAGLITDLRDRGLLDETLVVWGGEFGRTPVRQKSTLTPYLGRDHHRRSFTMLMAGGGFRSGLTYGKTDEIGFFPVEGQMTMHDLHATLLHTLGINHESLTWRHLGRDFRLTDVSGNVVKELLS